MKKEESDYEMYKKAIKELERNTTNIEREIDRKISELKKCFKLKMLLAYKLGGGEVSEQMLNDILEGK